MKQTIPCLILVLACAAAACAQDQPRTFTPEQLRQGTVLYPYKALPDEDPMPIVKRFEGLRTTDVLDAMQAVGLQDRGIMDKTIRPLWRDTTDKVAHRFYGVAITYQYVPSNKPAAYKMPYAEFKKWHSHWYQTYAPETFAQLIRPGHALVIDAQGIENTGFVGSNNTLNWYSRGITGVVTNGNCRDTDELILERIPVYSKYQGGGTRPGRIEAGAINVPIVVGGALVRPGDIVVGDGDGVVVVPREQMEEVLKIAWDIAKGDKAGRQKLYEKTGKSDATIK
ncbi:MAG: RraA family protein [Acidobacteria bacterium]|nr:RraA family protein [Acidobacteriota bacterium]